MNIKENSKPSKKVNESHFLRVQDILNEIGESARIIVLSDSIGLPNNNPAVRLHSSIAYKTYHKRLMEEKNSYENNVFEKYIKELPKDLKDTILIKKSVLDNSDIVTLKGIIWHEIGHIKYNHARDTSDVYLFEINSLASHFSVDKVMKYLLDNNRFSYMRSAEGSKKGELYDCLNTMIGRWDGDEKTKVEILGKINILKSNRIELERNLL